MQAKEFFAQFAVLPLSRRGGSEGAKKNNEEKSHHANKERRSSSIQHQHQPNTEIDGHADVDARSMTMTKTISRSSMQSSPAMRSIASTAEASQHSSSSTAITMMIPNRIGLCIGSM
jgi:hypothetical protein